MKNKLQFTSIAVAALMLICLTPVSSALAEPNPYYIGVSQAFSRDSNLFRSPDNQPATSDVYSTTGLLGGINQPFGRQRFYVDANVKRNIYQDITQLNNTGYGLAVGLDWETIERLSGTLSYSENRTLARYGADDGPQITKRNLEKNRELLARARLGLVSTFALEGSLTHRQLDYSAAEFAFHEFEQNSGSLGLLYRPSGLLTLGAALRYTKGKYPFAVQANPGVLQRDDFDRKDLDLTSVWVPTGLSTVSARLSFTRETHEALASRDLSGATGALTWDYKPTGKLAFTTALIRDTGAESSFNRFGGAAAANTGGNANANANANAIGNNSRLSSALQLRALYEVTAKIKLESNARYARRKLVNTFALTTGGSSTDAGSDRTAELSIGARYEPTRVWLLGCDLARQQRSSSSSVSYPYSVNQASCSAQLKLQ